MKLPFLNHCFKGGVLSGSLCAILWMVRGWLWARGEVSAASTAKSLCGFWFCSGKVTEHWSKAQESSPQPCEFFG